MPKEFDNCRKHGGKIRTISLKGGKYMHVCSLNGKTYKGEVKEKVADGGKEGGYVAKVLAAKMGKKKG